MLINDQDVVIVGAGPAGSSLAIELSKLGAKVLLVDRESFPRDKPCGDYVSPKGIARLKELGVSEAINTIGSQAITSSRLYLNKDLLVSGDLPTLDGLPNYGLALPRKELDNILFARAAALGVNVQENFSVTGYEKNNDGVSVTGKLNGKNVAVSSKLLIGADGANSIIAKNAGLDCKDPRYVLASLRAYVHGLSLPHTLMFFDERFFPGYGWIFPVRDGLCNIGVGMVKESIVRGGVNLLAFYEQFKLLVHRLAESRGERAEIEPHQGFPIKSYGGARRNYFDGGLLIGEAASFVDPINGEGIPLALDSAKLAAAEIKRCFESGDFSEESLASYEKSWRGYFDPDLGISDLVVSLLRNKEMQPLWLSLFKTMSFTARSDKKYADITGGILGGVIPARRALTPEMFLRALVHPPAFWREVYDVDSLPDLSTLLVRGKQFFAWQSNFSRLILGKDSWTREWLKEIAIKQASVLYNQAAVNHHG